jgi:hypothetical protein
MKIEITLETLTSYRKVKSYNIAIGLERSEMPALELCLWKSWGEEEFGGYETDWGWETEADEKFFEALSEETQEEITEWIELLT